MKHRHIRTTHEEERTREGGAFVVRGNFARCNDLIWILGCSLLAAWALLGACESAASTTAADFIVQRRSVGCRDAHSLDAHVLARSLTRRKSTITVLLLERKGSLLGASAGMQYIR